MNKMNKLQYLERGRHISLSWCSYGSSILVELVFGVLDFVEGGNPEDPEKKPRSRVRTNKKINQQYDTGTEPLPGLQV